MAELLHLVQFETEDFFPNAQLLCCCVCISSKAVLELCWIIE